MPFFIALFLFLIGEAWIIFVIPLGMIWILLPIISFCDGIVHTMPEHAFEEPALPAGILRFSRWFSGVWFAMLVWFLYMYLLENSNLAEKMWSLGPFHTGILVVITAFAFGFGWVILTNFLSYLLGKFVGKNVQEMIHDFRPLRSRR